MTFSSTTIGHVYRFMPALVMAIMVLAFPTSSRAFDSKRLNVDERLLYLLDVYGSETPTSTRPFTPEERSRFISELKERPLNPRDRTILERIEQEIAPQNISSNVEITRPFNVWTIIGYTEKGALLTDWHGARPSGGFAYFSFEQGFTLADTLRIEVQPRLYGFDSQISPELVKLLGTLKLWNIGLQAGRSPIWWGYTYYASLPLGYNAEPFDYYAIRTMDAFRLPWIFRYLGNIKFSFFYAPFDDSPRRHPSADEFGYRYDSNFQEPATYDDPALLGQKVDFSFHKNFEMSLGKVTMFGGKDPRTGKDITDNWEFGEYFNVFFSLDQYYDEPGGTPSQGREIPENSNSLAFIDLKLRLPWLAELVSLDYITGYYSRFADDANWTEAGGYLPSLAATGDAIGVKTGKAPWNIIFEYYNPENTGFRIYEHGRYTAGHSYRGKWLGSPYGGDSLYYFFRVERETEDWQLGLDVVAGRKKNKSYLTDNAYVPGQAREIRFQSAGANLTLFNMRKADIDLRAQVDKIENVRFFVGETAYKFTSIMGIRWHF